MARRVAATPVLPLPPVSPELNAITRYSGALHGSLFRILAEIAARLNLAFMSDGSEPMTAPVQLASYTVAGLGSVTPTAGTLVYVSNGTGNKRLAIADGTNWRFPDGNLVS